VVSAGRPCAVAGAAGPGAVAAQHLRRGPAVQFHQVTFPSGHLPGRPGPAGCGRNDAGTGGTGPHRLGYDVVPATPARRTTRPSGPGSYAEEIEFGIAQLTAVLTGRRVRRCRWWPQAANRSAPFDLPRWARTIKRAVRHERLLAIRAYCRGCPRFRLIFEIKYCIGSREAAVTQGPLPPAGCGGLWGSWTGQPPPVPCRIPHCLPFPQVKGQTASPRVVVVRGRVELPTFRFSGALSSLEQLPERAPSAQLTRIDADHGCFPYL